MRANPVAVSGLLHSNRRLLAGGLAVAGGLLWLLLVWPIWTCTSCGVHPASVAALRAGGVAALDSALFEYSPGWQVSGAGASPPEPAAPWAAPAGVVRFEYTGRSLWLQLAPGDYWAYLYATVDGAPANRLAQIAGNVDSRGDPAGYRTLLAPETVGWAEGRRAVWVEIHRAAQPGVHRVRLELWRGWGQRPLRAAAVDVPASQLYPADLLRPLLWAPRWPGVLALLGGGWLVGPAGGRWLVGRMRRLRWPPAGQLPGGRVVWVLGGAAALLLGGGLLAGHWLAVAGGLALLGCAGLLRPALWVAALVFALPFAYAVKLPLLPGRALEILDVGVAGGLVVWAGHRLLRWGNGQGGEARGGFQRFGLLAGLVGWALVASVDTRYPELALREWRTLFLNALLFAMLLHWVLSTAERPEADRQWIVCSWLAGAAVFASIGVAGLFSDLPGLISAAEGVRRVQSLYDSANNLALYLDRTLAVTLALLVWGGSGRTRWVWGVLAVPQALAWLFTFSKGALLLAAPVQLAVVGGAGLWMLGRGRRGPLALLGGLAIVGLLLLVPFAATERFQRLFDFEQGTGFLRIQLWRSAWQMALDHWWLGVGPDHFLYTYRSVYLLPSAWQEPNLNHPHNLLLDWWTRLGLVGLGLGGGWLAAGMGQLGRWLRAAASERSTSEAALAVGCLAAAAAGLAHGLIDASYALPDLMWSWVLLFGLGSAAWERCCQKEGGALSSDVAPANNNQRGPVA